jgi:hypothetical protein
MLYAADRCTVHGMVVEALLVINLFCLGSELILRPKETLSVEYLSRTI